MSPHFPFSAVVGQEQLKLALILNAIDRKIGGVLISGSRGIAKSTLARGLADLPAIGSKHFVTLPLGATEEQLIGSLSLEKALQNQQIEFKAGLLAKADNGVLYVDEVNLLPDHLVDQLLDVAASGVNHIERDGISHQHTARFVLIGTMNPEEGELRPQLLDRFALCVELQEKLSTEERVLAVQRRIQFDNDPAVMTQAFNHAQSELNQKILSAQEQLSNVVLCTETQLMIAELCAEAGCEGLRADIAMQRAAKAYAAWLGETEVTASHIEVIADFVLCHRRHNETSTSSSMQSPSSQSIPPQPPLGGFQENSEQHSDSANNDDWGEMPPESLTAGATRKLTPFNDKKKSLTTDTAKSGRHLEFAQHGRKHSTQTKQSRIHWPATLTRQALQSYDPLQPVFAQHHHQSKMLNLVVLDISGSSLHAQGVNNALGAVEWLYHQSYLQRHQFGLIRFGNDQAEWAIKPQQPGQTFKPHLANLHAGGGTPLAAALELVSRVYQQTQRNKKTPELRIYIMTDGISRHPTPNIQWQCPVQVIDIERTPIRLGKAKQLAERLHAEYLHIDQLAIE